MFYSPSSPPSKLPDSVLSSTPNSGTFSSVRTRLNLDPDKTRPRLKNKCDIPRSAGSLAEAADEVKEEIRFKGQRSRDRGDHSHGQAGGGAVKSGQYKSWTNKQFYGQNVQVKSSGIGKEDLDEKINRVTSGGHGSSKCGGGDFNLNLSLPKEEEIDLLDTIDLSLPSPSITPPSFEQKVLPHNIGFKNYGNTCYMSAVTQALLGLNIFVLEIITIQNIHADGRLLQALSHLCLACTKGEIMSANQGMVELKRQFEFVDKEFEGNKMQDASEFLCRALEKMSIELLRHTASPEPLRSTQDLNIIENYFLHKKEETIVCKGCKFETKCKHSDLTMWCDTVFMSSMNRTRSMSLQQLLEQSLAEEVIERRCEKCACDEATTSSRLVKLPRVLVIILKRYRYNEQDQISSNKVSRLVDIPETVSLTSLVSDNAILPSLSQNDSALPSTPVKTGLGAARMETPVKFKGLGVAEVGSLNEDDQLEYIMFLSQKEAIDKHMNCSGADEDADLKAALEASLVDDHINHSDNSLGRTLSRKRSYGQLGGGTFTHGEGDIGLTKLDKAMEYMKSNEFNAVAGKENVKGAKKPSPAVRKSPRKKVELEQVPYPKSIEQEEADLQEALNLSRQEPERVYEDTPFKWAMEDVENNNLEEVVMPEHSYQLHSVVSHQGSSARSGHYVADVYRFDVRRWMRYDDARVTLTDGVSVRTGGNTANGYILTYLHQTEWKEARRLGSGLGNT